MSIARPLFAASLALLLAAPAASAAILVSAPAGSEPAAEEVIADAVNCVASVLAYQVRDAEQICTRVIAALPDEALGYKFRGLAYLLAHRFDRAEPDFREAARLAPDDAENQAGYAQALSGQGRYAEAIPGFDKALALSPNDVRFLAARCWARAGEGSDLGRALADCNRAVDLAPELAAPRANRGVVRLKQQNWRAAIQDYTRALDTDPAMPMALFGRGYAYARTGEMPEARADIGAARRMDASIDALFIRVGVLPASCRDGGDCPLPAELRPGAQSDRPVVMVSYRPNPGSDEHADMDSTVRVIALGRMDVMLERTAELLGTSARALFQAGWDDATPGEAVRHLMRQQLEYKRQQKLACDAGVIAGRLCQAASLNATPGVADNAFALRREIDHTMDAVHPFWRAVCQARQARCILE